MPVLKTKIGHILSFAMDGAVKIEITPKEKLERVVVRPINSGIQAKTSGQTYAFTLDPPRNLSVEMNGDLQSPLFVFANGPEKDRPSQPQSAVFRGGQGARSW